MALSQVEMLGGENKVQELLQKCEVIAARNLEEYFIGHLRISKIKDVSNWTSWIESTDRLKLAE